MSKVDGYDHRQGAVVQLQHLLQVSNDLFLGITSTIKNLALTTLNVDRKAQYQSNELSRIEDNLKKLFPAVFDSTEKLAFARKVAMQYHRYNRHTNRNTASFRKFQPWSGPRNKVSGCDSRTQGSQPSQLITIPSLGKDTIPSQKQAASTRSLRRRALLDDQRLPSSRFNSSEYPGPRKVERDGGCPPHRPKGTDTVTHDQKTQASCEPMPNREMHHPTTTTISSWTSDTTRPISYIHRFLQNCSPPLDHLLSRFIDVGFKTPAILREVAQKWTIEERRELMKRVAPGLNGNMTELELAALERGFQALRSSIHDLTTAP